jgi:hypothetical protein
LTEFVTGKLVSGGGVCEGCGKRLEEGAKVYAPMADVEELKEYFYCEGCRPQGGKLPKGVQCVEPAFAVEEPDCEERGLGIEIKAGSLCSACGHYFEEGEWLFVGVVEGLHGGFVYCDDCYEMERELQE